MALLEACLPDVRREAGVARDETVYAVVMALWL
jgi:hypothetical protein